MATIDDTPEEDKLLKQSEQSLTHKHEWEYLGNGVKRGDPTIAIYNFYCKWCTRIKDVQRDQRQYNLMWDEDENKDFRDK